MKQKPKVGFILLGTNIYRNLVWVVSKCTVVRTNLFVVAIFGLVVKDVKP